MTRRLVLFRHAKSDWSDPWRADRARPLAPRGLRDAPRMGMWLKRMGIVPQRVLLSPAQRAVQTWAGARDALGEDVPVYTDERLYVFDDHRPLIDVIREKGGDAHTLMIVGHNEALHDLAVALARTGEEAALKRLRKKFPTAAVAVIDLPIDDWRALEEATPGRLVHFMRPKALTS